MPLEQLVDYFNERIQTEQDLSEPPLLFSKNRVVGRFGNLILGSDFEPIRLASSPPVIMGHDAALVTTVENKPSISTKSFFAHAKLPQIVNLDRLCRTIHMLNYLPLADKNNHLFLSVHPRHVLGVKRDHGAYFEEVIERCGLSSRQVAISMLLSPVYERQFTLLLKGLKNYQARGYEIAVKFDDKSNDAFLDRYYIEFLYRLTPDFVRFEPSFLARFEATWEGRQRRKSLLSVILGLDTELMIEGIRDEEDAQLAKESCAALIKGEFYESEQFRQQRGGMG